MRSLTNARQRVDQFHEMTRYTLRVYSHAGYYPDKTSQSLSRRRVERRAARLRREGFATTLACLPGRRHGTGERRPPAPLPGP